MRAAFLFFTLLAALWASATPAGADAGIGVAPSLVEVSALGPGRATQELVVFNDGPLTLAVDVAVETYLQASGERSAVAWLKVSPAAFQLDPGGRRPVSVAIEAPTGALAGGRYAAIAFRATAQPPARNTAGRLSVPFLIAVGASDNLAREARLDSLRPVLERDGRLGFRAGLANLGNTHLAVRDGTVIVSGANSPLRLSPSAAIVPGSTELLSTQGGIVWREGSAYQATAAVDYAGSSPALLEHNFTARTGVSIASFDVQDDGNRGLRLRLGLRNDGTLGLMPRVQFAIRDASGKATGDAEPAEQAMLWPGQSIPIVADLALYLPAGSYAATARVTYGGASPAERKTSFRIGNRAGLAQYQAQVDGTPLPQKGPMLIALLAAFGLASIIYQRLAFGRRLSEPRWPTLVRALRSPRGQMLNPLQQTTEL